MFVSKLNYYLVVSVTALRISQVLQGLYRGINTKKQAHQVRTLQGTQKKFITQQGHYVEILSDVTENICSIIYS